MLGGMVVNGDEMGLLQELHVPLEYGLAVLEKIPNLLLNWWNLWILKWIKVG